MARRPPSIFLRHSMPPALSLCILPNMPLIKRISRPLTANGTNTCTRAAGYNIPILLCMPYILHACMHQAAKSPGGNLFPTSRQPRFAPRLVPKHPSTSTPRCKVERRKREKQRSKKPLPFTYAVHPSIARDAQRRRESNMRAYMPVQLMLH